MVGLGGAMRDHYEYEYGDSSTSFDDSTLCAYLGVILLMSIHSSLSVDEFY